MIAPARAGHGHPPHGHAERLRPRRRWPGSSAASTSTRRRSNGLADIAFNYLVDGQVDLEERYGGVDKNVVGSHTAGFNTGTIGIALIGNFSKSGPASKQVQSLDTLLAWRLDVGHIDPKSRVTLTSEGNERFARGKTVLVPGHLRPPRRRQHRLPRRRRLLAGWRRSAARWRRRAT